MEDVAERESAARAVVDEGVVHSGRTAVVAALHNLEVVEGMHSVAEHNLEAVEEDSCIAVEMEVQPVLGVGHVHHRVGRAVVLLALLEHHQVPRSGLLLVPQARTLRRRGRMQPATTPDGRGKFD